MTSVSSRMTGRIRRSARGLGWEVFFLAERDGNHAFTYFQQVAALDCNPITGEITYGLNG